MPSTLSTVLIDGVEFNVTKIDNWEARTDRINYTLECDEASFQRIMQRDLTQMAVTRLNRAGLLAPNPKASDAEKQEYRELVKSEMREIYRLKRFFPATEIITPAGPGYINRNASTRDLIVTAMTDRVPEPAAEAFEPQL